MENRQDTRQRSGAGAGLLLVVLGMILVIVPNLIPVNSPVQLSGLSKIVLVAFGVLSLVFGGIVVVLTKLYVRTTADKAFIRTGSGGATAILDGGTIVVPTFHTITWVTLESMKLNVDRAGQYSLRTADYLRANVKAEIYLKVKKAEDAVKAAAATLGSKADDPGAIQQFVEQKLDAALRAVVAQLKLEELNSNREKLQADAKSIAAHDLEHNGLEVESFVITHIEQTPSKDLRPDDDIFDAAGAKVIAEKTSEARIRRNEIEQDTERQVTEKKVNTAKQLLELDLQKQQQEATNEAEVRKARAEAESGAAQFEAQQKQTAQAAQIASDKATQAARISQEQELSVRTQEKQHAEKQAEVKKEQALELAAREKEIAIAEADKRRAEAEKQRISAETERETEKQRQLTVQKTAEAERLARTQTIDAEAKAQQQKIVAIANAEAQAETQVRKADAEARSAEKQAEAQLKLAEAAQKSAILQAEGAKQAKVLEADGLKAEQMVPVQVASEQVAVEQKRVEVEITRMEAQAKNSEISVSLQTTLARITADKEAQIAFAAAMGQALAAAKMTIWGDGATVAQMTSSFTKGQLFGNLIAGATEAVPDKVQDAAFAGLAGIGQLGAVLIERLTGQKVNPADVEKVIAEMKQ